MLIAFCVQAVLLVTMVLSARRLADSTKQQINTNPLDICCLCASDITR